MNENNKEKENKDKVLVNRSYKASVFGMLFEDRENAAELYYALSGIKCKVSEVIILTLLDTITRNFINDLALIVRGQVLLICEHQSSWNENMPLRILIYLGRLYEKYLSIYEKKKFLYQKGLMRVPTPEFAVLYNGIAKPPKKVLLLNDAFSQKQSGKLGKIEMKVPIIDINKDRKPKILQKSRILDQYSELIALIRMYQKKGNSIEEAIELAIKECVKRGILAKFLKENGGDIVSILKAEFSIEEYGQVRYEEGMEKAKLESDKKWLTRIFIANKEP